MDREQREIRAVVEALGLRCLGFDRSRGKHAKVIIECRGREYRIPHAKNLIHNQRGLKNFEREVKNKVLRAAV